MTRIICITGKQGSGKSTLAEALVTEYMRQQKLGAASLIKFADPLYGLQKIVYDYITMYYDLPPLKKGEKDRKLLQFLGTDWAQERFGQHVWADVWARRVKGLHIGLAVTDDMRFPHELDTAKMVNAITVRLNCSEFERAKRIGKNFGGSNHPSETALNDIPDIQFDHVFDTATMSVEQIVAELVAKGVFQNA